MRTLAAADRQPVFRKRSAALNVQLVSALRPLRNVLSRYPTHDQAAVFLARRAAASRGPICSSDPQYEGGQATLWHTRDELR
jgi:hypothetical protein